MTEAVEKEITQEIEELEERILNLKHKRARISLYPPIKLGEDNEINLLTDKDKKFKITVQEQEGVGEYSAVISCEEFYKEPVEVILTVNEHNEISEINRVKTEEYFRWDESKEAYVHYFYSEMFDTDRWVDVKFKAAHTFTKNDRDRNGQRN